MEEFRRMFTRSTPRSELERELNASVAKAKAELRRRMAAAKGVEKKAKEQLGQIPEELLTEKYAIKFLQGVIAESVRGQMPDFASARLTQDLKLKIVKWLTNVKTIVEEAYHALGIECCFDITEKLVCLQSIYACSNRIKISRLILSDVATHLSILKSVAVTKRLDHKEFLDLLTNVSAEYERLKGFYGQD